MKKGKNFKRDKRSVKDDSEDSLHGSRLEKLKFKLSKKDKDKEK